jgi:hypothetical protein
MTAAARIAEALTGYKVKAHDGNYLVRCPAHDDDIPSLSLCDSERGVYVHCFAGCSAADIYAAVRRKGCTLETAREGAIRGSSDYARQQADKAAWMWKQRRPLAGSIAERYLRNVRRYGGSLPSTLTFWPPRKPEHHSAMIAAFAIPDEPKPGVLGKPLDVKAVHLTFLKPDGGGKADTKPAKITVGSPRGRPIALAPPNDLLGLAITEGIEDALTAHLATGLSAWAAGSAGFMPALASSVPNYIEAATIFAHTDKGGQDGAQARGNAAPAWN